MMFRVYVSLVLLGVTSAQNVVQSIANDLPYDVNNKLTTHVILYNGCEDMAHRHADPPYGFIARPVDGEALAQVFKDTPPSSCQAACVERGVDQSHAHAIMPHMYYPGGPYDEWIEQTCRKVEVCLMNYHNKDTPVKLFWINTQGEKVLHLEIKYGEKNTRCFSSFISHNFEAVDGATEELLGKFTIEYTTVLAFGKSPPSDDIDKHAFDEEIERTLHNEWARHNRVKRTFSPLGFKKGRLPDDLFASMTSFFVNNRGNAVLEEWGGRGVFVNWWETNCSFIQIPWELKRYWQVRLLELVQAWAGVPVEQTDLYGMRRYESGARLLTHVDRETTHAVSLIVNVAQGNLTEPWPVEVQDHMDRLHEVIMHPGDIVYYESAKCLHGRNRPLSGPEAWYLNLFSHYRPTLDGVGDPEWMNKPNHEGTPDPVMEVEGDCRLEMTAKTAEAKPGQLGFIQSVKCDDPRLGDFISPNLFTAKSGDDLIKWWRMTAPEDTNSEIASSVREEL